MPSGDAILVTKNEKMHLSSLSEDHVPWFLITITITITKTKTITITIKMHLSSLSEDHVPWFLITHSLHLPYFMKTLDTFVPDIVE